MRERAREVLRTVLADVDTAVGPAPLILMGGRRGRGVFAVDLLDEVLRRAPRERLAPMFTSPDRGVRRFVYRLTVDEGFLADRAGVVRACARYVVRQVGGDPAAWYRDRCARPDDPALSPGAVAGLAECGVRADAESLWPLPGHPSPRVRARAVAGLRTLDVTDVRRLRALLDDPAPGVVREATLALLPFARSLDPDRLTERLGGEWPRHARMAAFRLLDACGGLVRLRAAVSLLDDPDVRLRERAGASVRGWQVTADVSRGSAEVVELLARGRHLSR